MKGLKDIFTFFRSNGCHHLQESRAIRQTVYTNLILLIGLLTFTIYILLVLLFIEVPLIPFLAIAGICHLSYITCFLLIRNNFSVTGKHWLVITTYATVAVFDHFFNNEVYTFLYLLAFMPAAMNIFSFTENKLSIIIYTSFPLFYILFTQVPIYNYQTFISLPNDSVTILRAINISLTFLLFVAFSGYMILNNTTKQKKLLIHSIGLQTTLDNSAASIWSIDKDFNLMATNIKYQQSVEKEFGVTGLKSGINLKKHPIWQKLPEGLKQQYYEVLTGKEIQHEIQLNDRYYEIKGMPVYDPSGQIGGATFGSRDITSKKKSEEALLTAKKMAEDANQAKARFLSNMSHELRTPLNGIIGITRIMQDEKFLPEQLNNFKTLQDLSEHTLQIVNNILDLAKIEAGKATLKSERFNLKKFIDKIYSLFAGTAQLKGIKFKVETTGETDIFLKGDEVRLSQALINLIGNAFKFTDNGSITLTVKLTDDSDPKHSNLQFAVNDTGIGIKKENLHKIFETFSQADSHSTRVFQGTGLGLSIAQKILNLMHSQINVESQAGKGSRFWFDISIARSSFKPMMHVTSNTAGLQDLLDMNILLAEDNKINQMVAARMMQKWKGNVTIASNGKEAFDFTMQNDYDLILMDLDMPVMDGYESVNLIKQKFPEMPVIALTAAAFEDMNMFLLNKGFNDVVQKPFVPEELYNKIMSVTKRA